MIDMQLTWLKCSGDRWCLLNQLNLNEDYFELMAGVYVIWRQAGPTRKVLRVGQGYFRRRLHQHRWEQDIMSLASNKVYVTWAALDSAHRDGAERFLLDVLQPEVAPDMEPLAEPLRISLPW